MPKGYILNENDKRILQNVVREYLNSADAGHVIKSVIGSLFSTRNSVSHPQVYIAYIPSAGIAPIADALIGTASVENASYTVCNIYKINSSGYLVEARSSVRVYNLSDSTIEEGYRAVFLSYGKWVVDAGDSSGSAGGSVWGYLYADLTCEMESQLMIIERWSELYPGDSNNRVEVFNPISKLHSSESALSRSLGDWSDFECGTASYPVEGLKYVFSGNAGAWCKASYYLPNGCAVPNWYLDTRPECLIAEPEMPTPPEELYGEYEPPPLYPAPGFIG